jgi:hypothetical protein
MHKIALYLYVQLEQDSNAQLLEPESTKNRCHSKNNTRFPRNSNYRQFLEEICTNQRVPLTMTTSEGFLNQRQRYQSIKLPQDFSDEEMARDWTLSDADKKEISKYRKNSRTFIAIQLSALRLYGRFLAEVNGLSPRIVNYLNNQLGLRLRLR